MKNMSYDCGYDQTVKLWFVLSSFCSVSSDSEVTKGQIVTHLGVQVFTSSSWAGSGTTRVSNCSLV